MSVSLNPLSSTSAAHYSSFANREKRAELCDKLEKLNFAVQTLKAAFNNPTDFVCAATTLASGAANIAAGNPIRGGIQTVSATKRLVEIWSSNNRPAVAQLLENAQANIDVIKQMEEANEQSLKLAANNLKDIQAHIKDIESKLKDINKLAAQGSAELKGLQSEISILYLEADRLLEQARRSFIKSQGRIVQSNQRFNEIQNLLTKLHILAIDPKIDPKKQIEGIIELTEKIQNLSSLNQLSLNKGGQSLDKGLARLNQAIEKQREADSKASMAIERAKSAMEDIQKKARYAELDKVEKTQRQIQNVQMRIAANKELLDHTKEELKQVQETEQFGTTSLLFGAVPAVLAAQATGVGVLGTGAAAYLGAKAAHNRHWIARRVGDWLFGIKENQEAPIMKVTDFVKVQYAERSSGYWGRYIRPLITGKAEQSHTVGKVYINLGNGEIHELSFNQKDKDKIGRKELAELQARLIEKVSENNGAGSNEISPAHCEKIREELDEKGLVPMSSTLWTDLKIVCGAR